MFNRPPVVFPIQQMIALTCILTIYICIILCILDGPRWLVGDCPLKGWLILRGGRWLLCEHDSHKQTSQSKAHRAQSPPLSQSNASSHYPPAAMTLASACTPEPTESIQTSQSQACFPSCLTPSCHGNHDKGFCSYFPLTSSASWLVPHVALHGVSCVLFPGICEYKNFFIHNSQFHVCLSYHTCLNKSWYIFKQWDTVFGFCRFFSSNFFILKYPHSIKIVSWEIRWKGMLAWSYVYLNSTECLHATGQP